MDVLPSYFAIVIVVSMSAFCWWLIARSDNAAIVKVFLIFIAAIPIVGPAMYFLVHVPTRAPQRPESNDPRALRSWAFLKHWNDREHVYLGWASFIFWVLAVVAYWMNDWKPGRTHYISWLWASYTDVDVIFFALLIGAVLTFGAALRAKVILARHLREASNLLLQPTAEKRPATE
jgi:hypothetical protein